MRVLVLVKETEESEKGFQRTPEMMRLLKEMDKYNDELRKAGILVTADGLKPSSDGKRIQFDGASRTVVNGPFSNVTDLVAGFWIWDVKDMDEAVSWVKRCPNPMPGPSAIEIRPFDNLSDTPN